MSGVLDELFPPEKAIDRTPPTVFLLDDTILRLDQVDAVVISWTNEGETEGYATVLLRSGLKFTCSTDNAKKIREAMVPPWG